MLRLTNKYSNRGKRAFTLVELIVVLVIIAILAAALVPALTGYIRRARRAKYIDAADAARTAAQAVMAELYGLGSGSRNGIANIVNGDGTVTLNGGGLGGDIRWDTASDAKNTDEQKAWGEKILNLLGYTRDNAPYIFVFGVGDPRVFGIDSDESYTVYYVAYVETSTSPAIFYVNGEWIYTCILCIIYRINLQFPFIQLLHRNFCTHSVIRSDFDSLTIKCLPFQGYFLTQIH